MNQALVRDGKYAVLVSYGFGAGWSTWGLEDRLDRATNARLVKAVLGESKETQYEVAKELWPDAYTGGLSDCKVVWVPCGTRFYLTEYDGSESLHLSSSDPFWN